MSTDLARPEPGALKPRAVAVLCALRGDGRSWMRIRDSIGDNSTTSTRDLLRDMCSMGLIDQRHGDERWYLTNDGIAWLETNGLKVAIGARL